MLARLQVREKLNLLVVIPLVMAALLLVPWLATTVDAARTAGVTATTADLARATSQSLVDLQEARLLAVAYLATPGAAPNDVVVAVQDARLSLAALRDAAQGERRDALATAADRLDELASLDAAVVARSIDAPAAVLRFAALDDALIDAAGLGLDRATDAAESRTLGGLDALLRSDEASSRSGALLLAAATAPAVRRAALLAESDTYATRAQAQGEQFARYSDRAAAQLYAQATGGPTAQAIRSARAALDAAAPSSSSSSASSGSSSAAVAAQVLSSVRSLAALRQLVEARVSQDVAVGAAGRAVNSRLAAYGLGLAAAAVLALVVALSVVVGRSVSRPLRRLTGAAGRVADLAQAELLRVADEDAQARSDAVPRLAAIQVSSGDEIGDLADAFNRVQATAALLLERQVTSRRNVAAMFASVGRRTSNLVGRQLSLIDVLERAEEDQEKLATLYRLDHVSTRLRRNASSLVVLSGASDTGTEGMPLPLADAVRAALGSVEEYQRVRLVDLPDVHVAPRAIADLVLMLAELIENAVLFSPPRTEVEVAAALLADGTCRLEVVDHGMGMPADRLAEENARLRRRERLDLAPTNVLGLFVVGRIARRYGVEVALRPTPDHGVTAVVDLPADLLVRELPGLGAAGRGGGRARGRRSARTGPDTVSSAAAVTAYGTAQAAPSQPEWVPPGLLPDQLPHVATMDLPVVAEPPAAQAVPPAVPAADQAPQTPAGLIRRTPGQTWWTAGDGTAGPTGSHPVADVPRRVPGRAWDAGAAQLSRVPPVPLVLPVLPGVPALPGSAVSGTVADPEATRRQLDDVDTAIARAREGLPRTQPDESAAPVPAPQPASAPADVPRRVPGAALRSLEDSASAAPTTAASSPDAADGSGRAPDPDRVRSELEELDDAMVRVTRAALAVPPTTGQLPTGQGPTGPQAHAPQEAPPGPPRVRRVPGATLAAIEATGPTTGPISVVPPDPQAVLGLVHELESAVSEAGLQVKDTTGEHDE